MQPSNTNAMEFGGQEIHKVCTLVTLVISGSPIERTPKYPGYFVISVITF